MKNIVVIYHGNCQDGFSGAWAAWKKLGAKADYIPAFHQSYPTKELKNKTVYLIDFVYSEEEMKKILASNKLVIAIDHHISAKNSIKLADDWLYSQKNSGAYLAWQYFYPKKKMPYLIKIIDDQDLWKFKVPHLREISLAIDFTPFNFKNWDKLARDLEKTSIRKKYIEKGKIRLEHNDQQINELSHRNAYPIKFAGYNILAINSPHIFRSKIGHVLATRKPPFAVVWCQVGNEIHVSLRSNGGVDVSKIAAKYGGGGHKRAAGFKVSAKNKFPWETAK